MIRDGSTIPVARTLQDVTQKRVLMLPLGAVDDGEHAQNEKMNRQGWGGRAPPPRPGRVGSLPTAAQASCGRGRVSPAGPGK